MADLEFPARTLKPYAEPIAQDRLVEGSVYFSVIYFDRDGLIPVITTWVYIGMRLDADDTEDLSYFQDVESYRRGVRYEPTEINRDSATFKSTSNLNCFFDYEPALNELLKCQLRRTKDEESR